MVKMFLIFVEQGAKVAMIPSTEYGVGSKCNLELLPRSKRNTIIIGIIGIIKKKKLADCSVYRFEGHY